MKEWNKSVIGQSVVLESTMVKSKGETSEGRKDGWKALGDLRRGGGNCSLHSKFGVVVVELGGESGKGSLEDKIREGCCNRV